MLAGVIYLNVTNTQKMIKVFSKDAHLYLIKIFYFYNLFKSNIKILKKKKNESKNLCLK